jgi:hypothetical protein
LNLQKREPTLEDVFVDLVGRSMEEVESGGRDINKDTGWQTCFSKPSLPEHTHESSASSVRNFVDLLRNLPPHLAVSAYVFVYRAMNAPEEYIGFCGYGGAMTAFWMNVLWNMSSQLYWEKEQGNLALYIMAPNSMMAVLLGMAVGGLVRDHAARNLVIIGLGSLFFRVQYAGRPAFCSSERFSSWRWLLCMEWG